MNSNDYNNHNKSLTDSFYKYLEFIQENIINELEKIAQTKASVNQWNRQNSEGVIAVIQKNQVFDKAGITKTYYQGILSKSRVQELVKRNHILDSNKEYSFKTCGLSLVFHPKNPFAPSVHLNYRHFEISYKNEYITSWFGGGSDLSPNYYFEEDCIHFHSTLKNTCDISSQSLYNIFKKNCDDYFFIKHRGEHRGIGGIFFDDLQSNSAYDTYLLVKNLLGKFIQSYFPILYKRYQLKYNDSHVRWQKLRRGRYVEFNLVYDKGTHFGLANSGHLQIENIFVSMPLNAAWEYNAQIEKNSAEETMQNILKTARAWIKS